jgi:single-stranded-DNA-specific exonuclease
MPFDSIINFLDLVVVSIASDIVPITGENRILAYYGLEQLNKSPRPGLQALIKTTGFEGPLNISNIVFGIGPRINAAGRLDDAKKAVRMLISETADLAKGNADILHEKNIDRKAIDKQITAEALLMLQSDPAEQHKVTTVLCNEKWHKGVIGIVASRLLDHYYRPTILLSNSGGMIGGSARSVKGFDIYEAIRQCSDLLEQFGGHMYAAGLSLLPENLEPFKKRFEEVVRASITPEQLIPEIEVDAIIRLKDITPSLYKILSQFSPFGPENMYPVFMTTHVSSNGRTRIVGDNHLKLGIKDGEMFSAEAIAFQKGDLYPALAEGRSFDICYAIEENNYNDRKSIQLNVKEIKLN